MFPALMLVIIQMPLQVPVFKRELMNKMYTPTIYYFARVSSGMLIQVFYPCIFTLVTFWGFKINESAENFFLWLFLSLQLNLVGCSMGYFCGVTFDDDNSARSLSTFLMLLFMLTAGGFNNAGTYPPFVEQIQYVSPNRYAVEGFFRGIIRDHPYVDEDKLLDKMGFHIGDLLVHILLGALFFMFLFLGWFSIWFKNRNY